MRMSRVSRIQRGLVAPPTSGGSAGAVGLTGSATLALSGLWRDYSVLPLVGTASAGTSSANNLTLLNGAPAVASLNSKGVMDFDGINDALVAGGDALTYVTSTIGSLYVVANMDTAIADSGAGTRYGLPCFFIDSGGQYYLGYSSAGVFLGCNTAADGFKEVVIAQPTGSWFIAVARFEWATGQKMELSVNGSAWSSFTFTGNDSVVGGFVQVVGRDQNTTTNYLDGKIAELGTAKYKFSDADAATLRTAANSRYGLSL